MRMSIDYLPTVVGEFFDSVLVPSAQSKGGMLAFSIGFLGGLTRRNTAQMVQEYLPLAKSLGVVDEQGMIDVDTLYSEASAAMEKGRPTFFGYTFDQSDLDKLRDLMHKHGV